MSQMAVRSDALFDATANNVKVQKISVSTASSADLIAAVTGGTIRVLAMALYFASSQTLKLQSGASTDLTGVMTSTSFVWPWNPHGWVETASGQKLNAVLGGATQLSGTITYIAVVPPT
jgi:hypothetical protein